jgi:hypothetical protein
MDRLSQLAAVIAIAAGAGLYSFSRHLDPPITQSLPADVRMLIDRNDHKIASVAGGWGMAFITLGVLGLTVPWTNAWVRKQCSGVTGGVH